MCYVLEACTGSLSRDKDHHLNEHREHILAIYGFFLFFYLKLIQRSFTLREKMKT
jgi:hypothetical protein